MLSFDLTGSKVSSPLLVILVGATVVALSSCLIVITGCDYCGFITPPDSYSLSSMELEGDDRTS